TGGVLPCPALVVAIVGKHAFHHPGPTQACLFEVRQIEPKQIMLAVEVHDVIQEIPSDEIVAGPRLAAIPPNDDRALKIARDPLPQAHRRLCGPLGALARSTTGPATQAAGYAVARSGASGPA